MREGARQLLIPGVGFIVLGALLFFVSEEIRLKLELMPFSFLLILVLVAGGIMLGAGVLSFIMDRLERD